MSKYIEIKNSNTGKVILDDSSFKIRLTRVVRLLQVGTCVDSDTFNWGSYSWYWTFMDARMNAAYKYSFTLTSDEEFFAIKLVGNAIDKYYGVSCDRSGKTVTCICYYCGSDSISSEDFLKKINDTIIYCYGDIAPKNDKYGIEIFDANGNKLFNSSDALLNITSTYEYDKLVGFNDLVGGASLETFAKISTNINDYACVVSGLRGFVLNQTFNVNPTFCIMLYGINYQSDGIYEKSGYVFYFSGITTWFGLPANRYASILLIDVSAIPLPS